MRSGNGWRRLALAAALLVAAGSAPPGSGGEDDDDGSFGFSAPIACKEVRGYEDYDKLPNAALTRDEKLIIYFLPRHFKSERKGKAYLVHFTQEGRIRRRGQKAVIYSLPKTLEYKSESKTPPQWIYLTNKLALKALPPGDYDYEIVLHDAVGRSAAAVRTLPFTILPTPELKSTALEKEEEKEKPGRP